MIDPNVVRPERLRPLKRAEYERLVEADAFGDDRVELLYGLLVTMSPQEARHSRAVTKLNRIFSRAIGERAEVLVQQPLALADDSEPEPDLALVPPGEYEDAHPTTAYLIVEVADSSLADDRAIKGRLYAESGVEEYWIVDVQHRRVERYLDPSGGAWGRATTHGPDETLAPRRFPDLAVPLAKILPRAPRA